MTDVYKNMSLQQIEGIIANYKNEKNKAEEILKQHNANITRLETQLEMRNEKIAEHKGKLLTMLKETGYIDNNTDNLSDEIINDTMSKLIKQMQDATETLRNIKGNVQI